MKWFVKTLNTQWTWYSKYNPKKYERHFQSLFYRSKSFLTDYTKKKMNLNFIIICCWGSKILRNSWVRKNECRSKGMRNHSFCILSEKTFSLFAQRLLEFHIFVLQTFADLFLKLFNTQSPSDLGIETF